MAEYSFLDGLEFDELDPELEKFIQESATQEPMQMPEQEEVQPLPPVSENVQGMSQPVAPPPMDALSEDRIKQKADMMKSPTGKEAIESYRSQLAKRVDAFNPAELEEQKQAELEDTEIGGFRRALGVFGSMLLAGAGQSKILDFDKMERDARKEVMDKFDKKNKLQQDNLRQLLSFEKMDSEEQFREIRSMQAISQLSAQQFKLQGLKRAYQDAEAARDPNSDRSQYVRDTIRKAFPAMKVSDKASALQLQDEYKKALDKVYYDATTLKKTIEEATAKQKLEETKQEGKSQKEKIKLETDLRKEINKSPQVKDALTVGSAYQKVRGAAESKTPAGDMSLIFAYMKMLDPNSTVREGEYAQAEDTTNIPGRVLNIYNKAVSGEKLNSEQRQQFVSEAENIYKQQKQTVDKVYNEYKGVAERLGLNINNVILDTMPEIKEGKQADKQMTDAKRNQALNWLKNNPNHPKAEAVRRKLGM